MMVCHDVEFGGVVDLSSLLDNIYPSAMGIVITSTLNAMPINLLIWVLDRSDRLNSTL